MRILQWLCWIVVIAIGAALPWLVHDWMRQQDEPAGGAPPPPPREFVGAQPPNLPGPEATSAAPAARSAGEKVSEFFSQTWLSLRGLRDQSPSGSMNSDRSRTAAARVGSALETELAARKLKLGLPMFIRIFKESDELELWMEPEPGADYILFKTWPICAWSGDPGPKLKEGDGQSPEGFYYVSPARMNPESRYHLSFDIGFPNEYDRGHGRTGSYLMVHGACVSIGCYAMTNAGIEEIYTLAVAALKDGQPFFRVHVFPFRMTDERMEQLKEGAKWFAFWSNLKEGYDYFEFVNRPPNVTVTEGRYQFD